MYVEIDTGFELYDLDGRLTGQPDPYQLYNAYDKTPPALKLALAKYLENLKLCRGNGGVGGGAPTPNSVSCVLANVPEFTAGGAAPAPTPAAGTTPPPRANATPTTPSPATPTPTPTPRGQAQTPVSLQLSGTAGQSQRRPGGALVVAAAFILGAASSALWVGAADGSSI